jgi:nitrogen regulatory protein PII
MKPCKRIEIVIEAAMVLKLTEALKQAGAPGYTLIPDVMGSGDRGIRRADELSGESSNCHVLIASDDPAVVDAILTAVRPLIARSGGICLVSDANWLRH